MASYEPGAAASSASAPRTKTPAAADLRGGGTRRSRSARGEHLTAAAAVSDPARPGVANRRRQDELVPELEQVLFFDIEANVSLCAFAKHLLADAGTIGAIVEVVCDRRSTPANVQRKLDATVCLGADASERAAGTATGRAAGPSLGVLVVAMRFGTCDVRRAGLVARIRWAVTLAMSRASWCLLVLHGPSLALYKPAAARMRAAAARLRSRRFDALHRGQTVDLSVERCDRLDTAGLCVCDEISLGEVESVDLVDLECS